MRKIVTIITIFMLVALIAAAALFLRSGNFGATPQPTAPAAELTPSPTPSPTPTPTPQPTETPEPEQTSFVFSFVGDCTLSSSQHAKNSEFAYERIIGTDFGYPFAKTVQYFADDYMSLANMEGTFTDAGASSGGTFTFKSGAEFANIFAEGGIDFVTLANNHSGDYLAAGREDTRTALDAAGVVYAGDNETCLYQREGGPLVGVYAKLYPTLSDVTAGIAALKEQGAEIIIAALHWGLEGQYRPTADQQAVGHAAIDAGAHIVYGSHPHVLQRTEEYDGGCILYSLGNWSFGGNTNPRDRDSAILRVTVEKGEDGVYRFGALEKIPCALSGSEGYNDYQPVPYEAGSVAYERTMSKLDGSFTGPDLTIDYSAFHKNETAGEPTAERADEEAAAPEVGESTPNFSENEQVFSEN